MKGQNKKKTTQKRMGNPINSVAENDYDLEKNIKKINSYSRNRRNGKDRFHNHITDSGENEETDFRRNGYIETPHASSPQRTGDRGAWESYTRLDDKITDFNYKNDQAHTDLRKELETKIKDSNTVCQESIKECKNAILKRLPIQWYIWTIIGLVAIATIWYMFSYIEVHPLPQKVEDLNKQIHTIEKRLDTFKKDTVFVMSTK